MKPYACSRRRFLRTASFVIAGTPLAVSTTGHLAWAAAPAAKSVANATVAIAACKTNALYGDNAGNENATTGRGPLHNRNDRIQLPGVKEGITSNEAMWRVPRIIVDEIAARPLHLCVIDGITSMSGGEGPWCGNARTLKFTAPGVLIVGFNSVATDAVGTAVMGYADPRAVRGSKPFDFCDNHLLMAEQAGLGPADLSKIDVRGESIAKARHAYNV